MKPDHDFPCEHCGPQVCELAVHNTRYRNALEGLLLMVEAEPEADVVGSELYIAIKVAQIALDPDLGWPEPPVVTGHDGGECTCLSAPGALCPVCHAKVGR